jgi:peptidoglycan hydrolase-like protein with peptidoglycan-binding domain
MRKIQIIFALTLASSTAFAQIPGAGSGVVGRPAVPPPPPASLTIPPAAQGVPPTPAPAMPGLPSPPASPSTPNTRGLPNQVAAELRPGLQLGVGQVATAQALLAQDGFYRGPIDGNLSGSTRASVRAFQASVGLPPTGELDLATTTALGTVTMPAAPMSSVPTPMPPAAVATPGSTGTFGSTGTNFGLTAQTPIITSTPTTSSTTTTVTPNNNTANSVPFPLAAQPQSSPPMPTPIFIQP